MNKKSTFLPILGYRRRPTIGSLLLLVLLIMLLINWSGYVASTPTTKRIVWQSGDVAFVKRVIDGDTLLLSDNTRVRLIGVDTPEIKHPDLMPEPFGLEAERFTKMHVEGESVILTFDRERIDRFGRLLAYVHKGSWFLNEELIRAGLSKAEINFPFSSAKKKQFRNAEEQAREKGVGIWASEHSAS